MRHNVAFSFLLALPFYNASFALPQARPRALPALGNRTASPGFQDLQRRDDPNPYDLSFISTYAAIGDSYGAGLGAGTEMDGPGDKDCRRFDIAYPVLLQSGLQAEKFLNLACSGAVINDVKTKQLPLISPKSVDLITVSAGGNDMDFAGIVKACVYLATIQSGCDNALNNARGKLDALQESVEDLLKSLAPLLTSNGVIIWTTYAQFWNEDTNWCDKVSWSFFDSDETPGLRLTTANRKAMNELVRNVNSQIASAVSNARADVGSPVNAWAVDWDTVPRDKEGRFCETADEHDPHATEELRMFIDHKSFIGAAADGTEQSSSAPQPISNLGVRDPDVDLTRHRLSPATDISKRDSTALISGAVTTPNSPSSDPTSAASAPRDAAPDPTGSGPLDYQVFFHPTEIAQWAISALNRAMIVYARAKALNVDPTQPPPSSCDNPPPPPPPGGPGDAQCLPTKTGHYVNYLAAGIAVTTFCNGDLNFQDASFEDLTSGRAFKSDWYFQGTPNEMELEVQSGQKITISKEDCKASFQKIIDQCDPQDDVKNPLNKKYGGSVLFNGDAVNFMLTPGPNSRGGQVFCNDVDRFGTYMNSDTLKGNINDFCDHLTDPTKLTALGPSQPVATMNPNTMDEVEMSAIWDINSPVPTADQCKTGFQPLLDECKLPDGDFNPANYKYGGSVTTDDGRQWAVKPLKTNVITDQKPCFRDWHDESCSIGDLNAHSDTGKNGHKIDKPALQQCFSYLHYLQNDPWTDGSDCYGQVTFFIHRYAHWGDPHECWMRAANDVSGAIDQGYSEYKRVVEAGFARCEVGFCIRDNCYSK